MPPEQPMDVDALHRLADEDLMPLVERKDPAAFELLLRPPRRRGLLARLPDRGRPGNGRGRHAGGVPFAVAHRRPLRPHARQRANVAAGSRSQPRDRRAATRGRPRAERGAGPRAAAEPGPGGGADRQRGVRHEAASEVRGALATLPDDQLKVIELAYFGGLTHSEIAEALGMPLGTVKGRMRLAMEKMRAKLAEGV